MAAKGTQQTDTPTEDSPEAPSHGMGPKALNVETVRMVPALEVPTVRDPGPGEKLVVSPTGTRSVVPEAAVDVLLTQGYTVDG